MGAGCSSTSCIGEGRTVNAAHDETDPSAKTERLTDEVTNDTSGSAPPSANACEKQGVFLDVSKNKIIAFGPMVIRTRDKTALFVWGKRDKSLRDLQRLLTEAGYSHELAYNRKDVEELLARPLPFLVIIDGRKHKKLSYDLDETIRCARETNLEYEPTIFVICDRMPKEHRRRRLFEIGATKIMSCDLRTFAVELCWFESIALPILTKIRSVPGLFTALENCDCPIEITDSSNFVQYINPAYENLTGCDKNEILGRLASHLRRKALPQDITIKPSTSEYVPVVISAQNNANSSQLIDVQEIDEDDSKPVSSVCNGWTTFPAYYSKKSPAHCQVVHIKRLTEGQASKPIHPFSYRPPSFRNRTLVVDTPLAETLSLLKEASSKAKNEEVQKLLQEAIRSLNFAEVYTPLITKFKKDDRVASNLYGGLVLNGPLNFTSPEPAKVFSDLMKTVSPSVRSLLELEETLEFDIFELERQTNARPMVHLAMKIFERWKGCEFLQCSENRLKAWIEMIESNYHSDNPYHNSTHASDVLHASAYYLTSETISVILERLWHKGSFIGEIDLVGKLTFRQLSTTCIDHSDAIAVLIAAVIHDVDHPGKGSPFLINTKHPLALLYNDVSVLENHHAALAFQLTISDSQVNIFENVPLADFKPLRKSIIDMVLATDMTRHFEYLTKFQTAILSECVDGNANKHLQMSLENKRIIRQILIKAADISNPTRPWHLCKQWGFRIVEEYFAQTAEERVKGLPLTMEVFDRDTCNIPQTQCSFIDMFVREMFKGWCSFGRMPQLVCQIESNYAKWCAEAADWSTSKNVLTMVSNRRPLGVNVNFLDVNVDQTASKSRLMIGRASVDVHLPDTVTLLTSSPATTVISPPTTVTSLLPSATLTTSPVPVTVIQASPSATIPSEALSVTSLPTASSPTSTLPLYTSDDNSESKANQRQAPLVTFQV